MDNATHFKIGGMRLPKLLGAFIALIAVIMFFSSIVSLEEASSAVLKAKTCLSSIEFNQDDCRAMIKDVTGVTVANDQTKLTLRQIYSAIAPQIAWILVWAAAFLIGIALYRGKKQLVPIAAGKGRARAKKRRK
ncbi:MAG: hypothetical protein HYW05_01840 [Candidatus Diapherotrites archaeon]|nr:hypothetical protein [Candidatus Diapherotrites archaeon]